jgi:RNA recognition motif-containing protein
LSKIASRPKITKVPELRSDTEIDRNPRFGNNKVGKYGEEGLVRKFLIDTEPRVRIIKAPEKPLVRKVTNAVGDVNISAWRENQLPNGGNQPEMAADLVASSKEDAKERQRLSDRVLGLEKKLAELTGEEPAQEAVQESDRRGQAKRKSDRAKRTIFIGNLSPETTIKDLEETFAGLSSSIKPYLYANMQGELLGTGAIVMANIDDANKARELKDKTTLSGREIRCMPFFSTSYRKFLQRVVQRDAVYLKPQSAPQSAREQALVEAPLPEQLTDHESMIPKLLLEPEPLPKPSSPQYILVRELFRIQDEHYKRRNRGIFVSGINEEATDEDLAGLFAGYGEGMMVDLRKKADGKSSGSALVTFETVEDAVRAREEMDGMLFLGQQISCTEIGGGKGLRKPL